MERVQGQEKGFRLLAEKVLSWITCTKRRLTTTELQHALAVEVGELELDEENLPQIEDMVSVCSGLVTVDEESNIIRLVHYTTQEYFEQNQGKWFPNAETDITAICVTYLSFHVFESGFCQTNAEFEERLRLYQLYDYAARNWVNHARKALILCQEVISFLKSDLKVEAASQALLVIRDPWDLWYSQRVPRQMTGLHLAAYSGLKEAIIALLEKGYNINSKDSYSRTPLSWAAANRHEALVKLLLEKGADLESKDNNGRTSLSLAAGYGHEAVVKLLLEKGAKLESKDKYGRTSLSLTAGYGHEAMVKLLLEKGAKLESKDKYGGSPLSLAAGNGQEARW